MRLRFLTVWCWIIASAQLCSLADGQSSDTSTCREYLGTVCRSYVGDARIQNNADIDTITLSNINRETTALRDGGVMLDEDCLHFVIFAECVSTLQPCQGTVWCGEQSKGELLTKAQDVCTCSGTEMCETAIFNFLARIDAVTTYTQESAATTGTCQDVTEDASATDSANTAAGIYKYSHWIGLMCIVAMVIITS